MPSGYRGLPTEKVTATSSESDKRCLGSPLCGLHPDGERQNFSRRSLKLSPSESHIFETVSQELCPSDGIDIFRLNLKTLDPRPLTRNPKLDLIKRELMMMMMNRRRSGRAPAKETHS